MVIRSHRLGSLIKRSPFFLSCLLLVHMSFSQVPPPVREKVSVVDDHLAKEPSSEVRIGALRVLLGSTKIADAGIELHNVVTTHERTSYGGFSWICLTVFEGRSTSRVWVESDDDMGGSDQSITSVHVTLLASDAKATSQCPRGPDGVSTVTFDNDLKLGSSAEDLKRAFGSAPPAKNGWWRYTNDASSGDHADLGELDVELRNGVVVSIEATYLETS